MPHIHKLIDFTVSVYIVYDGTVLLVDHKKLGMWLPPGGHIELDEDSDQALMREIKEETGLVVEIVGERPSVTDDRPRRPKSLLVPRFMDIHHIDEIHRHHNMVFFGRAATNEAVLEEREHNALRWFTPVDLDDPTFELTGYVRFYAKVALTELAKPHKG